MLNKEKVALFDFCETLANFQTADTFVYFVIKKSLRKSTRVRVFIFDVLKKIRVIHILSLILPKASINKRFVLWQIRGESQSFVENCAKEYYYDIVRKNLIPETIKILQSLNKEGCRIVIVSAGYEIYLKYFMDEYHINKNDLISVKIGFKNGVCTGFINGGDRLYDKTEKLEQLLNRSSIYSIAFSDSQSDLPLLEWADEAYVVRRIDKENWNKKYNEIIWK